MSVLKPTTALNEKQFYEVYGNGIPIENGMYETTEDQEVRALTAFNCFDDIAVFAIKKIRGKNMCAMGWRFKNESLEDIQLKFHELLEPKDVCDLYIVGGNIFTTQGKNCLLDRIHLAIRDFFIDGGKQAKVVQQHTNPNLNKKYLYVTANLQIDGKLTFCSHIDVVKRKTIQLK